MNEPLDRPGLAGLPPIPNPLLTHKHKRRDHIVRVIISVGVIVAVLYGHTGIAILTNLVWIWTDID